MRVHPDDATLLALLSVAVRTTDPAESSAAAAAALGAAPTSAWVHDVAAWTADATGRPAEARRLIQTAMSLDPHSASRHRSAAQLLADDPATRPAALAAARRAIELEPDVAATWVAAGVASLHAGMPTHAEQCFEHALGLEPGHTVAMKNLALVREATGSVVHAMDMLTALIRTDPSDLAARSRIDSLARRLLGELVWLSLPVGLGLAIVVSVVSGAR